MESSFKKMNTIRVDRVSFFEEFVYEIVCSLEVNFVVMIGSVDNQRRSGIKRDLHMLIVQ
jgi:hypothetical protein